MEHPPKEVVFASPAAKADESFTTAPEAMVPSPPPSSPASTVSTATAPVDSNKLRDSLMMASNPTAITDASTIDGSSLGKLSLSSGTTGYPAFLPTSDAQAMLRARYDAMHDSDTEDGKSGVLNDKEIDNAEERQRHKIAANSEAAAQYGKKVLGELKAQQKKSAQWHDESMRGQEDLQLGQEEIKLGQEELQETMALQHEENKDILLELLRLAKEKGDGAKVKMLQHQIKSLQAEARAREKKDQEKINTLEQALDKERSQNARGRSNGLALASSNVRPSAPSAPIGKRPVVAEMVHCGRRTTTAQVAAEKTRSRKSTFFSTKP